MLQKNTEFYVRFLIRNFLVVEGNNDLVRSHITVKDSVREDT